MSWDMDTNPALLKLHSPEWKHWVIERTKTYQIWRLTSGIRYAALFQVVHAACGEYGTSELARLLDPPE